MVKTKTQQTKKKRSALIQDEPLPSFEELIADSSEDDEEAFEDDTPPTPDASNAGATPYFRGCGAPTPNGVHVGARGGPMPSPVVFDLSAEHATTDEEPKPKKARGSYSSSLDLEAESPRPTFVAVGRSGGPAPIAVAAPGAPLHDPFEDQVLQWQLVNSPESRSSQRCLWWIEFQRVSFSCVTATRSAAFCTERGAAPSSFET